MAAILRDVSKTSLVLELGAGTGELACKLACLGVGHIVATDRNDEGMILQMTANIQNAGLESSISAEALDWGDVQGLTRITERFLCEEASILVIASECIHWQGTSIVDEDPLPALAETIAAALRQPAQSQASKGNDRLVLVAFKERNKVREASFTEMLKRLGLDEAFPKLRLDPWATDSPGDFHDDGDLPQKPVFWLMAFQPTEDALFTQRLVKSSTNL